MTTIDEATSGFSKGGSISLEEELPPSKQRRTEMWKAFTEILDESGESMEIDEVKRLGYAVFTLQNAHYPDAIDVIMMHDIACTLQCYLKV
uniref:Uncharacterized protein n=1 Tax=Amphimedon queenslandica TaxID=400682 RepID=A0A1X7VQP2_AMPQE